MASTTRAIILSFKPFHTIPNHQHPTLPFLSPPRHLTLPPSSSSAAAPHRRTTVVSALGGGGGISDTRKSEFSREFEVIATMLKRIEPLDSSDISKFVSESAKDSMKQTISTMLGILPSHQFSVSVRVSELPFHRLLVSSIITGYTLWNAEYRVSLMRNFDLSLDCSKARNLSEGSEELGVHSEGKECEGVASTEVGVDSPKQVTSDSLKGLSPETLSYIEQLEAELCSAKQELDAQKNDSKQMDSNRCGNSNSLLQYLRSLESYMVTELSQPSSVEVKQVIYELVQNTIQKIFKDVISAAPIEKTEVGSVAEQEVGGSKMFTTSRDYLAKLLFWCMLLGHHLRGLENRLHLSCVVGLL